MRTPCIAAGAVIVSESDRMAYVMRAFLWEGGVGGDGDAYSFLVAQYCRSLRRARCKALSTAFGRRPRIRAISP